MLELTVELRSNSQARAWHLGLLMTWPQLSHEAPLPRVLLLFPHRLGSSQGSACSLQVSVFPAKASLSPHSPAPCWAPGGLAAPGPLRLAPRARLLGREVRLCFQAGKEWSGLLSALTTVGTLPTRVGQADAYLGHWASTRATRQSWPQGVQTVRSGRSLRPRPAVGTSQLLPPFPCPGLGAVIHKAPA